MISKVKIRCAHCGKWAIKSAGHVNRAKKLGARLFCSRVCFGKFYRNNKSKKQRVSEKAEYDREYRKKNEDRLKITRHEWFMKDYAAHPKKYKKERQRRMEAHVEYCRKPEYRRKKKSYDQHYRAHLKYGEFAQAAIVLIELESLIDSKRARIDKDCINKCKKRKKLWKNLQPSNSRQHYGKRSVA